MRLVDILTIGALVLGPLLGIQLSVILEADRKKRERQLEIFRILMQFRTMPLAANRVQALNLIDLEFNGSDKKSKDIQQAWRVYYDNLCNTTSPAEKRQDLDVDLLQKMGVFFGYSFDSVYLKRVAYMPEGHVQLENEQNEMRKFLLQMLKSESSLQIRIINESTPETTVAKRTTVKH